MSLLGLQEEVGRIFGSIAWVLVAVSIQFAVLLTLVVHAAGSLTVKLLVSASNSASAADKLVSNLLDA